MTGRRFGAQEAKEIGFVSDVFEGGRKGVLGESKRNLPDTEVLKLIHRRRLGARTDDSREESGCCDEYEASYES